VATSLPLYLEDIEGVSILHALDLPGCYSEGSTEAEAIRNFPAALAAYRAWLTANGTIAGDLPTAFSIVERVASHTRADGYQVNALFEPERSLPDTEFLARCRHLLGFSGADVLSAIALISPDELDTTLAAGQWTPRQIFGHVTRVEWWYLAHLADIPNNLPGDHPPDSPAQFETVHAALVQWVADIPPTQFGAIVVDRDEKWSTRKVLRRALWHERTHTAELIHFGTAIKKLG
jgi:predicted RNase H-like HicB family nuclease